VKHRTHRRSGKQVRFQCKICLSRAKPKLESISMPRAPLLTVVCLALAGCSAQSAKDATTTSAASSDPLVIEARGLFEAIPADPGLPSGIAADGALVDLGKHLFFDPRLSASHAISCASCHNLALGGADAAPASIGHGWQRGSRNSPTVLNAVFNTAQFWDGRAKDLEEQAGGPVVNPAEMAMLAKDVPGQIASIPGYAPLFQKAFPGEAQPITMANMQRAIAAFEATLITPDSPFDRFLGGDTKALTVNQKQGLRLFIDKGCASCHAGRNMGGAMYAPFGVVETPNAKLRPPGDKGRFAVTRVPDDAYSFKVPALRNIVLTAPYFHSGSVWDLQEAVSIMGHTQLGEALPEEDAARITDFLSGLTGRQPQIAVPVLPPSMAGTVRPRP
jgi:cytochrome c peroxidase